MKKLFWASEFPVVCDHFFDCVYDGVAKPKVGFIANATDTYDEKARYRVEEDRELFRSRGCELVEIDLLSDNWQAFLEGLDILYVDGGNTFYLLQCMRQSGFDAVIDSYLEGNSVWYVGSSAGSMVAGGSIGPSAGMDYPDLALLLDSYEGLGLVDHTIIPHRGKERYNDDCSKWLTTMWQDDHYLLLMTDYHVLVVDEQGERVFDVGR